MNLSEEARKEELEAGFRSDFWKLIVEWLVQHKDFADKAIHNTNGDERHIQTQRGVYNTLERMIQLPLELLEEIGESEQDKKYKQEKE